MPASLDPFLDSPERSGVFLDFDGTLSEIVNAPGDARPVEGARDVLQELAARYAVVTIVSGRGARELIEWLGPEVEIWGTHGAERSLDGEAILSDRARTFEDLMSVVRTDAEEQLRGLGLEGVILEDKRVMLALHFRAARDQEAARAALDGLAEDLVARHGLRRAGGRLAFELRPPEDFSKAAVVLERAREAKLQNVMYVGDDRVDLPGFDALDKLEEEGMYAVRVAVDSPEAPPELLERADLVVGAPALVVDLLRTLLP